MNLKSILISFSVLLITSVLAALWSFKVKYLRKPRMQNNGSTNEQNLSKTSNPSKDLRLWSLEEIARWEKDYVGLREFWVVLPRFLGTNPIYFEAMVDNLAVDKAQYVYFLHDDADVIRLRELAKDLSEQVEGNISHQIRYIQLAIIDSENHLNPISNLLHLANYFIANPYGPNKEGFQLFSDDTKVVGGVPLPEAEIHRIVNILTLADNLLTERIPAESKSKRKIIPFSQDRIRGERGFAI